MRGLFPASAGLTHAWPVLFSIFGSQWVPRTTCGAGHGPWPIGTFGLFFFYQFWSVVGASMQHLMADYWLIVSDGCVAINQGKSPSSSSSWSSLIIKIYHHHHSTTPKIIPLFFWNCKSVFKWFCNHLIDLFHGAFVWRSTFVLSYHIEDFITIADRDFSRFEFPMSIFVSFVLICF